MNNDIIGSMAIFHRIKNNIINIKSPIYNIIIVKNNHEYYEYIYFLYKLKSIYIIFKKAISCIIYIYIYICI